MTLRRSLSVTLAFNVSQTTIPTTRPRTTTRSLPRTSMVMADSKTITKSSSSKTMATTTSK